LPPVLRSFPTRRSSDLRSLLTVRAVAAEGAGGRELAQLVADHRLLDEDGHVLTAVVDADRVAHHLGDDGGAPAPGLDHAPVAGGDRKSTRLNSSHVKIS